MTDLPIRQFDIFKNLKEGTTEIHKQTEGRVPIFRPGFNLDDYANLLELFYGFWYPVEAKLSQIESLAQPALEFGSRLKSPLLRTDLITLGRDPAIVKHCAVLPTLIEFPQAVGCLYVLEGSTLGARVIRMHLAKTLGTDENSGAAFFNAYGAFVGQRWSDFKDFVQLRIREEESNAVVDAARDTFMCFHEWLGHSERVGVKLRA